MSREPTIRASLIQDTLDAVEKLAPAERRRVLDALPPGTEATLRRSTRVDWLPFAHLLDLLEPILAVLGEERFIQFQRQQNLRVAKSPILATVLKGALSLFAGSPRPVLRLIPRVNEMLMRGNGKVRVEDDGEYRVRMVIDGAPEVLMRSAPWRLSQVAGYQAVLELTGYTGEVQIAENDMQRARVVVSVRWDPRR